MKNRSKRTAAIALALLLSVTGGLTGATASMAAPNAVSATTYSDSFTKRTFDLMNAERAKVGSKPLVWNQGLADVSQDWSKQLGVATMDVNFDWNTIHRPDAGGSLIPSGAGMYREIIGFNFTPEQIVSWWMGSPSHKDAMLHSGLTDGGLGYVVPTSGPYKGWYLVVSNMAGYKSTVVQPYPSPVAVKAASYGGQIGAPYGAEAFGLKNGGSYQCFPAGCIVYSPASGARMTAGSLRAAWGASGFENGALGYPVTDEVPGLKNGGTSQNYQGGAIVWSAATGARVSTGGIRATWAASGYENGLLGYPVTDEISGLKNGGVYQCFQGGCILWSPASGSWISTGAIRTAWASNGLENGRLGYPTSNEYPTGAPGAVAQNYQGGVIYWSPEGSAVVYR